MKKVDLSSIKRVPYKKVLLGIVVLIVALTAVIGGRYVYVHKIRKPRDINAEQQKTQEKLIELAGKKDCRGIEKIVSKTDKEENGFAVNFQYLIGVGDCYYSTNDKTNAEKYYKQALSIAESVKDSDAIEVAKNKLQPKAETKSKTPEATSDTVL